MKIWVIGANGLLGSALRSKADLATSRKEADIADWDQVSSFAENHPGITHIINCAAFSLVDLAEQKKGEAFAANVQGPINLARLAKNIGARLIHVSTDYVFQGNLFRPLHEEDEAMPCNYYGWTKREGELAVLDQLPSACIIRTSWLFGSGGKNFVAQLLCMLREREEVRLTDDHWGRPTYVLDLADAIWTMLAITEPIGGIYHFANQGATNKYLFGCAMKEAAEACGMKIGAQKILPVPGSTFPTVALRPAFSVFDTSKIEKALSKPIRPWQEALKEYLHSVA